jgi:radical SAM superfamily enzyme YgiQ (UPF0313 family)
MRGQFKEVKEIAKQVKIKNPVTIIIVGGGHLTVAVEEAMSDPNIDVVIVGKGEKALLKTIKKRIRNGVVMGEIAQSLDDLTIPARHLVKWYLRRGGIVFPK